VQVARALVEQEHGQFSNGFAEAVGRGVLIPQLAEQIGDQRVVKTDSFHRKSPFVVLPLFGSDSGTGDPVKYDDGGPPYDKTPWKEWQMEKDMGDGVKCEKKRLIMDGTHRTNIKPGLQVRIVLKQDQRSGALTEGVVKAILTKSATHPHGIKVRLESGQVGRVKEIVD